MVMELLQEARQALKAGDRREAVRLSQRAIKQDPQEWRAWWIFANAVEDDRYKIKSLKKIQQLNPQHERSRAMLDDLQNASSGNMWDQLESNKAGERSKSQSSADAKAKAVAGSSDDDIIFYSLFSIILVVGGVWLLTLALDTFGNPLEVQGAAPEDVARQHIFYLIQGDTESLGEVTCDETLGYATDLANEFRQDFSQLQQMTRNSTNFDVSQLEIEEIINLPDRAVVRITGNVTIDGRGFTPITEDIDNIIVSSGGGDLTMPLVVRDRRWVACWGN